MAKSMTLISRDDDSDDVASRLQVFDLNKSDLQGSSRFAKDLFEISIFLFFSLHEISVILLV